MRRRPINDMTIAPSPPSKPRLFVISVQIDPIDISMMTERQKTWAPGHTTVTALTPNGDRFTWRAAGPIPELGTYINLDEVLV